MGRRADFSSLGALDARSLAVGRVGAAALLLWDLAHRATSLTEHYTDLGAMPRAIVKAEAFFSVHMWGGSATFQTGLFVAHAIAALGLLIGWRTRWCAFACWLLLVSLHDRNPSVLFAADAMLKAMLLWGVFLPWGRRWSVDARFAAPASDIVRGPAAWAYLLQVVFVYVFTLCLKSDPVWRSSLTAVYYPLVNEQMARPSAAWLLARPALIKPLTAVVLAAWTFVPLLLLMPWHTARARLLSVAIAAGAHLGIAFFIRMDHFPAVALAFMLPLLPGALWEPAGARSRHAGAEPLSRSWESALIAGLLTLVLLSNLSGFARVGLPSPLDGLARALSLQQNWGMFAPSSRRLDGWYVFAARLDDGSVVDLFRGGAPVSAAKPDDIYALYGSQRRRRYFMNLLEKPELLRAYLRFRCRQEENGRIISIVTLYYRKTDEWGQPSRVERLEFDRHACASALAARRAALL